MSSLLERLRAAVDNRYVVDREIGRGGMGTVTEISLVWNKLQTHVLDPRPLVLLGDCWPPVVQAWQRHLAVSDTDVEILRFANSPEEAVEIIQRESRDVIIEDARSTASAL